MALRPLRSRSSGIGSLAHSARSKQLERARWSLIVVGIFGIVVMAANLALHRDRVKKLIQEEEQRLRIQLTPQQKQMAEDAEVKAATILYVFFMGVFAVIIVLGVLVKQIPLVATVTSLVLFLATIAVFAALNPKNILAGWIWKIGFSVALIQSVQAGIAYQQEKAKRSRRPSRRREEDDFDEEDEPRRRPRRTDDDDSREEDDRPRPARRRPDADSEDDFLRPVEISPLPPGGRPATPDESFIEAREIAPPKKRSRPVFEDEPAAGAPAPPASPQAPQPTAQPGPDAGKFVLRCGQCQRTLRVPETMRGKRVKCPACGAVFVATS